MNEPVNYAVQCAIEQAVIQTSSKAKRKGCGNQKDRIPWYQLIQVETHPQTIRFPNLKKVQKLRV